MISILLICTMLIAVDYYDYLTNKNRKEYYNVNIGTYLANAETDFVYVSDIKFYKANTGWGQILRDTTSSNTPITLKMDGSYFPFEKGIWAHATSTIDIDLTEYQDFAYFTTYYGVNQTSGNRGNGVKFYIYTSKDGNTWDLKTDSDPKAMMSNDQAVFAKVDIQGAKYLRLYADANGANGNDHSVWADAKLIKASYKEVNATKTLEEYDEIIKTKYQNAPITGEFEKTLLQRELVRSVGQYTLNAYVKNNSAHRETLSWLMDNVDILRLYLVGGTPDGSYLESLNVLSDLYHAYASDFNITTKTKYGTVLGDLYKRMAITLSLTHSTRVALWMDPSQEENGSNAVERYKIYKEMHLADKFVVSKNQDHTGWFESLKVEEMRFILNNIIDDEEILWLYDYTQKEIDAHPGKEEEYLQPHHYMKYIWPDYMKPEYHDEKNKEMWSEKYGNFLDYGVTFRPGLVKLWMNIDNGAVCGGISKIGSNIRAVHGTPSSVISQPGHAALIYYRKNENGDGYWTIDNDVSGWSLSGKTETLSLRMPLGWGDEEYLTGDDNLGIVTYILLAQGALNDFDNYQASRINYMLADVYKNDINKLYEVYRTSLKSEPLNIDAWYGLIKTYRMDSSKTEKDYYELAQEIIAALKYYPYPMYHLLREINKNLSSVSYQFQLSLDQTRALEEASVATANETIQVQAVTQEAKYLLGISNPELASFSFDGENAGKIVLADRFNDSGIRWDYSIDGKQTWTKVSFAPNEEHAHLLTKEELQKITAENDIYVHIEGLNYEEENLYHIDIQKYELPSTYYGNDLENRVVGVESYTEWRLKETDPWTSYQSASPDLTGNKEVQIRIGAHETNLPSEVMTFTFTDEKQMETEKYIPVSHLSIEKVSTEAAGRGRYATNTIDGNLYTSWHSDWNGNDPEKYITIKLDQPFYLSALEYFPIPEATGTNGRILSAKIEVSLDNENWQTVVESTNWENDTNSKKVSFESTKAQYIRLTGVQTNRSFITAAMINLYHDGTKDLSPIAGISYSTTGKTNQDVVARLVNESSHITITNNDGKNEYTFKENGTFTFEFTDDFGHTGSTTATVSWIDKTAPKATITFNTEKKTNQEVIARVSFDERVKLLNGNVMLEANEDGSHTLTFEDNDQIELTYQDEVGNIGKTNIKVDWIDKIAPTAQFIYSNSTKTEDPVTVTLIPSETVKVLNNNGKTTYTFNENGTFTFEFQDDAGNIGTATVDVTWITKKTETPEEKPGSSDTPSNPSTPDEPQQEPTTPDEPQNPSISDTPNTPNEPDTPQNQETPSQSTNGNTSNNVTSGGSTNQSSTNRPTTTNPSTNTNTEEQKDNQTTSEEQKPSTSEKMPSASKPATSNKETTTKEEADKNKTIDYRIVIAIVAGGIIAVSIGIIAIRKNKKR